MRSLFGPFAVAALFVLTSCGESSEAGSGADAGRVTVTGNRGEASETERAIDETPASNADDAGHVVDAALLAEINALVPDRYDIVFESITVGDDDERVAAAAPRSWEVDDGIGVTFEPPREGYDFDTEMKVNGACQGFCEPTDWASVIDDSLREGNWFVNDAETEIVVDSMLGDGARVVVAHRSDGVQGSVFVNVFRWDDEASHFFRCNADLGERDAELEAAFVAACEASIPLWL